MAQPAEAKAAPTWGAPCRMSRIVKSAAPARPSNHTVIWIFPGAFIVCSRAIRADARRCAYPEREQIYAEQRPISSGNSATAVAALRRAPKQVRQQGAR